MFIQKYKDQMKSYLFITLLFLSSLGLTSCKKEYSCNCSTWVSIDPLTGDPIIYEFNLKVEARSAEKASVLCSEYEQIDTGCILAE